MKLLSVSLAVAGLLLGTAAQADEALAKAKGCLACHTVDKKLIGPMYKEVAKKYAGQKDAEATIAGTIVKGTPAPTGVGWQKAGNATLPFMPPNAGVKPDEAAKLAKWILTLK
ncbi:c-type cytochrome [Propionivibrio dicarboxylicus]|uniref:Cytochrome c n=1 Tax=Propionivibrio dicarboxylicus TaxID=83767 RepID=A0A1G7WUP3_9RHOO|nr:c-type cytochrome [Propionivibrio dicarboxylicus]SDG75649.1 cytochrome c [Propionivibrio dicarboxylicus]